MMESAAPPMPQYFHAAEAMDMLTRKPSPTTSAAGASRYFVQRATAAGGNPGLIRTDREHLSELERKLMEARQRFQDLKEEKCHANLKGCGCSCCPHGYVRARDEKATSVGPDSRSFSETSNLPAKKSATSRQHLTRSVKSISTSQDTTGAEHGSLPNSEGLLLAVDKFLSMK